MYAAMLQIPPEALWERVPGATQQDVRRWKQLADQGSAFDRLTGLLDDQMSMNGDEPSSQLIVPQSG